MAAAAVAPRKVKAALLEAVLSQSIVGACSFSPDTLVATPTGEASIGSLNVGDAVLAYNPATGKVERQSILRVD